LGAGEDTRDWAYPKGIFVAVPAAGGPGMYLDGTDREVTEAAKEAANALGDCVAAERQAKPELAATGAKYAFTLTFTINTDGSVHEGQVRRLTGSAPLLACMTGLTGLIEAKAFKPLPPSRKKGDGRHATWVQLSMAATILTTADAQGRGYLFLKGERAWEQALRENRHWTACKRKEDCVLAFEACEVLPVAAQYEAELIKAARQRVKGPCRTPAAAEVYSPACVAGRCKAEKK
jgi:hypothetical protein